MFLKNSVLFHSPNPGCLIMMVSAFWGPIDDLLCFRNSCCSLWALWCRQGKEFSGLSFRDSVCLNARFCLLA